MLAQKHMKPTALQIDPTVQLPHPLPTNQGSLCWIGHSPALWFGLKSTTIKDYQYLYHFNCSFKELMEFLKQTLTCWGLCSGQRHSLGVGEQKSSGAHLLRDNLVARQLADNVTDLICKCALAWKSVKALWFDDRRWDFNLTIQIQAVLFSRNWEYGLSVLRHTAR